VLTKRIIPCLDIKDGRTVKGINFINIRDAGDPVELGAAAHVNIPFTVGGGISSIADGEPLLDAGADKVSINSAAVKNPALIDELARAFGSQFVVLAIDARKIGNQWLVHTHGGSQPTEKKLFSWSKEGQDRGAGEILFTSMDHDGTKAGFALDPLSKLNELLNIPVIASGGAGRKEDFLEAFVVGIKKLFEK